MAHPGARRLLRSLAPGALALGVFALALTRIDVSGTWYGAFLVRGASAAPLELRDDLLLGEGARAVAGLSFAGLRDFARADEPRAPGAVWLQGEWDEALGRGIVRNHLADGTELVTLLSRFDNGAEDGGARHGVFVGGSLPDVAMEVSLQNQSGMAYHDRAGRWRHVWCNANEAMWDVDANREIDTASYRYLGSRVVSRDPQRLVIESTHEVMVGGVPLRMNRVASFTAGQPYLLLSVTLENLGASAARYMFLYGDEPWVGHFGSAFGNLGWTEEGVFADEARIDPSRHRAAGIVDTETGTANFLAWLGDDPPDLAYVSNAVGELVPDVPLASSHIFIGLEWRYRTIRPGEIRHVLLAVGMAERDARGRLRVPATVFRQGASPAPPAAPGSWAGAGGAGPSRGAAHARTSASAGR